MSGVLRQFWPKRGIFRLTNFSGVDGFHRSGPVRLKSEIFGRNFDGIVRITLKCECTDHMVRFILGSKMMFWIRIAYPGKGRVHTNYREQNGNYWVCSIIIGDYFRILASSIRMLFSHPSSPFQQLSNQQFPSWSLIRSRVFITWLVEKYLPDKWFILVPFLIDKTWFAPVPLPIVYPF